MTFSTFNDLASLDALTLTWVTVGDGRVVLSVTGEVDIATSGELDRTLANVLHRPSVHRIEVDLAGLRFLDASGILALLRGSDRARRRGCQLLLTNVTPGVRRVLQITGASSVLGLGDGR
ncbi:STAS domain-containing protein [Polymorphospora rubra]|uniref:Anti-sigma factor antagonist n=1 Tax=Polymorphospora rubra TaxID=338584 RepID=A0A810NA92_9ACTN|nr:STAS domain-containing protein [Polymorphospora rubra]BCJ70326.1 hypothetical protein Prubr_73470 [Polymorphospora rubra]